MHIAERTKIINDYTNSMNEHKEVNYFVGVIDGEEVTKHFTNTYELCKDYPQFNTAPVISEIGKSNFNISATFVNGNTLNFGLSFNKPNVKIIDVERQIMMNGTHYEVYINENEAYLINVSTITTLHVERI